jgi:subtilase family serine protease
MRLLHTPVRAGAIAILGLAMTGLTGSLAATTATAATARPAATPAFAALRNSLPATTDTITGRYRSSRMSVEVTLAPRNQAGLAAELAAVYNSRSRSYHHWLAKGQFYARYAPTTAERDAVSSYLRSAGLVVRAAASPFLVRATGSSQRISAAFRTTLSTYRGKQGTRYFSNSAAVRLPAGLAPGVIGVIGLSNTVREQSMISRPRVTARPAAARRGAAASASCETPYLTVAEAVSLYVDNGSLKYGFGGGPGCAGLTPAQTNSIYGAPNAGRRGKGAGVTLAVFELSAYQHSDIDTWARTFYGPGYRPPLADSNVDGGPLKPICPTGDSCPAAYNGYSGDIEVDADIENQLALAPDASRLIVYDAPNDETGQTELDEYTAIARQDVAESVSSSWGECENDAGASYAETENVIFEQMALQGQSLFNAAGDTGAYDCIRSDGTTVTNVMDPASQPWVTSVGGTSLESNNPGTNPNPGYPAHGESVWNVDNLCSDSATGAGGQDGFFWCAETGAGGGGSSQFWGRPSYQRGPGINNPYTTRGNGTTQCSLAADGTPCREVPDISADADEYTPYAEYCTGSASTPYSVCAGLGGIENVPGWFGIGGTSLSSPLWSGVIADRDGFLHQRTGNVNPLLYQLYTTDPGRYFNDVTGAGQRATNNGLFPARPGYDEATGIGTPKLAALITGAAWLG